MDEKKCISDGLEYASNKIIELKEQLSEKEKEIERLKGSVKEKQQCVKNIDTLYTVKLNKYKQAIKEAVEICDEALGEWDCVTETYTPESLLPFKNIKSKLEELIKD